MCCRSELRQQFAYLVWCYGFFFGIWRCDLPHRHLTPRLLIVEFCLSICLVVISNARGQDNAKSAARLLAFGRYCGVAATFQQQQQRWWWCFLDRESTTVYADELAAAEVETLRVCQGWNDYHASDTFYVTCQPFPCGFFYVREGYVHLNTRWRLRPGKG